MKKSIKVLGITALAAIIGFTMTACDGSGSSHPDLPPAGDGRISFDGPQTFPVFTRAGTPFVGNQTFTHFEQWDATDTFQLLELSAILNAPRIVNITDGILALQIGTPTTSAPWIDVSDAPGGITFTPGLRLFGLWDFTTYDGLYYLYWSGINGYVDLVYADRAGRVSGAVFHDYDGEWFLANWDLRQGWNTIINTWTARETRSFTGRPGNNFRWVVDNGGPNVIVPSPGPDYTGGPSDSGFYTFSTDISQTGRAERGSAISRLFR